MQDYYTFINNEWKTTFNLVYNTDYESKKHEYSEIDITKIYDNNYNVNRNLVNFIRTCIVSGTALGVLTFAKTLLGNTVLIKSSL